MKYNRNIEGFLSSGEWMIDKAFGLNMLNQYLHDVGLASKGVPLNYHEKRKEAISAIITPQNQIRQDYEYWNEEDIPEGATGLIRYSGVMFAHSQASTRGADMIADDLYKYYANPKIDSIIVELDTGGGQSSAGEIVRNAMVDANKPVIIYAHKMCSAGVLGFGYSDEIIASSESSVFGSIGVMYSINSKALKNYKKNNIDIYSKKSERKNEVFKEMLEGNFESLIEEATRLDENFMRRVSEDRNLKGGKKKVAETLSGATFRAVDAKGRGLIDSIGTFKHAIKRARFHASRTKK